MLKSLQRLYTKINTDKNQRLTVIIKLTILCIVDFIQDTYMLNENENLTQNCVLFGNCNFEIGKKTFVLKLLKH